MGLRDDTERYSRIGEEERQDLIDFIKYGDMSQSDENSINLEIKIVELPEFQFDEVEQGGLAKAPEDADVEEGDPLPIPVPDDAEEDAEDAEEDGDEDGDGDEPGDEGEPTDFYEVDPEEFAKELDEELGLDLEPKGKKVKEEVEGSFNEIAQQGVHMDEEYFFKQGLKRKLALDFDEEYIRELLRIDGFGPKKVFNIARERNINVSYSWVESAYADIENHGKWDSLEEFDSQVDQEPVYERVRREGVRDIPFRNDDERYRHPEIVKEYESQVVVVNIRDVSGSVDEQKRDLIQRTMAPLDWYLNGKYDSAVFIYIAHNSQAWETERREFFGLESGGGTRISSAYELAQNILEERFPWEDWNRYIFAAGDGENQTRDTERNVIPLMEEIETTKQAYIEVNQENNTQAIHGTKLEEHFEDNQSVAVNYIRDKTDIEDVLYNILSEEGD